MDLEAAAGLALDKEREFEDLYHEIECNDSIQMEKMSEECEIVRDMCKKTRKRLDRSRSKYQKLKIRVLELDNQVKKLEDMNLEEDVRRDSLDRQLWALKKSCG